MKIRSLFDLVQDSRDVVDFFEGVENQEQMISRLERIKKREFNELLACVDALRISIDSALEDTLEMSGSGIDDTDENDADDGDGLEESDLSELGIGDEDENPEGTPPDENQNPK